MTDNQLLESYVQQGSSSALCELVRRNIDMVHAAAYREVGDAHLADDITQAVFLVLMRRAGSLPPTVVLGGWLFKTTLYVAAAAPAAARRQQNRQKRREREASRMESTQETVAPAIAAEVSAALNEALGCMAAADRDAIVLRYLRGQSTAEVALALGTTEPAARQRLSRALERLRKILDKRGPVVAVAALIGIFEGVLNTRVSAAVAGRVEAVAAGLSEPSAKAQSLAQGTLRMIRKSRIRVLSAVVVAAVIAAACIPLALSQTGGQKAAVGAPPLAEVNPKVDPAPIVLAQPHPAPGRALAAAQSPAPAADPVPAVAPALSEADAVTATVHANTAFATDIYQVLNKANADKNLFMSPHSMTTILGLTADGARGKTLAEMDKVLHIDNTDALHPGIASIAHQLAGAKDANRPYQLSIANALWQAVDCPFTPDFRTLAEKYYDTVGVTTLDFRADPESARVTINKWVEDKTLTKIKDILPPNSIDRTTGLVLANAIYFKGAWQTQFTPAGPRGRGGTTNQAFHVTASKDVQTPMMVNGGQFAYFENDDVQAVSLPYKAGADRQVMSMLVVLPKKADGLAAVEKGLSPEGISAWIAGLKWRNARVWLPRFKITTAFDLTKTLPEMGMVEAFDKNNAHLEALGTPPPGMTLYISHVFHKSFVDVNEEGTEAAAATVVVGGIGGGGPPQNVAMFRADHPFLFFIRFEPTNSILFMGHVMEPSPADPKLGAGTAQGAPRPQPPAPGLKDAKAVAAAALELVKTTRLDTAYVSDTVHPAILASLNGLETAANAVADDDGKDPAVSEQRIATLSTTLARTATLAGQMVTRANETQESKDKSAQLQAKLTAIAGK